MLGFSVPSSPTSEVREIAGVRPVVWDWPSWPEAEKRTLLLAARGVLGDWLLGVPVCVCFDVLLVLRCCWDVGVSGAAVVLLRLLFRSAAGTTTASMDLCLVVGILYIYM